MQNEELKIVQNEPIKYLKITLLYYYVNYGVNVA